MSDLMPIPNAPGVATSAITGFPLLTDPYSNITPFTYRDGVTYLEVLESLKTWLQTGLVPYIDTNYTALQTAWDTEVASLVAAVNTAITTAAGNESDTVNGLVASVNALVAEMNTSINTAAASATAAAASATTANSAAAAALAYHQSVYWPSTEATATDQFSVRFNDESAPFFTARELDDSQGWIFAIYGTDGGVILGQRTDGTWYPTNLDPSLNTTPIVRWGDSLTANAGTTDAQLSTTLKGRQIITQGIGGQTSQMIAARQGGVPTRVTISGGVIPASGSVGATLTVRLASDTTTAYPCVIAGVAGTFTATDSVAYLTGTFTRTTPGNSAIVQPNEPVQAGFAYRDYWPIYWYGRNNFKQTDTTNHTDFPSQIVSDLQGSLDWNTQRRRALILSIPPWVGEETGTPARALLDQANAAIRDAFPREYVDVCARLRDADLITAVGKTPSSQDTTDIGNGLTPSVFRLQSDSVTVDPGHLGPTGYTALYMIIGEIYASKGWI